MFTCARPFSVHSFYREEEPDQLPWAHSGDMAATSAFLLQCINLEKCATYLQRVVVFVHTQVSALTLLYNIGLIVCAVFIVN